MGRFHRDGKQSNGQLLCQSPAQKLLITMAVMMIIVMATMMTIIMDSHGYVHVDTHESPSKWRILNFKLTTEDNKYRGYFCFQIEKATS